MDQNFGIKNLKSVCIKAASPFVLGEKAVVVGEPVLYFRDVELAHLSQSTTPIIARGGQGNMPLVIWEGHGEVHFQLSAGVLSQVGLSLLHHSRVLPLPIDDTPLVPYSEVVSVDLEGKAELSHIPASGRPIFCFLYNNNLIQEKITYSEIVGKEIVFDAQYKGDNVCVDYYYEYGEAANLYIIDKKRLNATFSLEGRIETKGEVDGAVKTLLVTIAKMRLLSDLSLRLGENVNPVLSTFNIIALPTKTNYSTTSVIEFLELQEQIT